MYSPRHVAPRRVDTLVSQLDVAPTVLGLLGISYDSAFFGKDALAPGPRWALLNHNRDIALLRENQISGLGFRRTRTTLAYDPGTNTQRRIADDPESTRDAASVFQLAYALYRGAQLPHGVGRLGRALAGAGRRHPAAASTGCGLPCRSRQRSSCWASTQPISTASSKAGSTMRRPASSRCATTPSSKSCCTTGPSTWSRSSPGLAFAGFALSFMVAALGKHRRVLLFIGLSIALATAAVTALKLASSRHCPWDLVDYGGLIPYTKLLRARGAGRQTRPLLPGGTRVQAARPIETAAGHRQGQTAERCDAAASAVRIAA